jgi:hypothetical protein
MKDNTGYKNVWNGQVKDIYEGKVSHMLHKAARLQDASGSASTAAPVSHAGEWSASQPGHFAPLEGATIYNGQT